MTWSELVQALARIELGEVVLLLACLVLSAAYAGAESSLTSLSEARCRSIIENAKEKGERPGRLLQRWVDDPLSLLTAISVGRTSASTGLAVAASLITQDLFHNNVVSAAMAIAVVLILLMGEVGPRSLAKAHAPSVAPWFMPLVLLTSWIGWPLVTLLSRMSRVLSRAVAGPASRAAAFVTEEEIVQLIGRGQKDGVLDKTESRMLASVIELSDTLVREVMVPRANISALDSNATLDEVMQELREQGHSRMPIYDGTIDEVRGFFHSKDLLVVTEREGFRLREYLRPVLFVPELMKTTELLKLFQKKKTHLAVVVDEFGGTAGVVALEDVLEEIVGPIQDEHDIEEPDIKRIDPRHFSIEGRASLYDVSEAIGLIFPEGAETMGGFLINRCGRMPRKGDRVTYQGFSFVVVDADERRVNRVEVERQLPKLGTDAGQETSGPQAQPTNDEAPVPDDPSVASPAEDLNEHR
jgi:putative hemolysin